MAWSSNGTSAAFGAGVNHATASGRGNDQSITLDSAASGASQGLDGTSARWASLTPHAVLAGAQSQGLNFGGMQRLGGSYAPGSMGRFSDEMSGGNDDYQADEE